tara:strand:- start:2580 stop:3158 length:579 start_codon:yes stop_codon:yes gene_type:complete
MKLVFATHNKNKLQEIIEMVPGGIEILSLSDINCNEDIEETGLTLKENARIKVAYVKEKYGFDCFSDDSGLEIEALNGAPGVHSARYAGNDKNNESNIQKVLDNLINLKDKRAQFRTIIAADVMGEKLIFEGIVKGKIIDIKKGNSGFGYDPIFIPEGYTQTFAQLGENIKNSISHRSKAFNSFINSLNTGI